MTLKQPALTKITKPILTGIFLRKRLFQLIDSSRNRPVVWLSGPPGSGKTTLVASYIEAQKIPAIWYRIDEGDTDIATFFYYMGLAAKTAAPLKGKPLPSFSQEHLQSIPTFAKRYFENLYNRLYNPPSLPFSKVGNRKGFTKGMDKESFRKVIDRESFRKENRTGIKKDTNKTEFLIVFDNYQEVSAESKLHEVIREGLSMLPEKINVIVISREIPPPQLVRLQANSQISFIGWDQIRLTLDETREIVCMRKHGGFYNDTLLQLQKRTDGWAAGLVLIMEMRKIRNIDYHVSDEVLPEEIFDYFASEIFNKADRETRDFLLKTAFFSQLTQHMAEELTGNPKSHLILSSLYQKNYFIQKYDQHSEIYQYHPLFRKFLLTRSEKTFSPEQISHIQHTAALILKAHGQSEDALGLFHDAENWPEAVQLILKQAPSMIAQGRRQTLETWISILPKTIVEQNPWLFYWMGTCRIA